MTEQIKTTAPQILGPFYRLSQPSKGGDLTQVEGRKGKATALGAKPIPMMRIRRHLIRTLKGLW
jgi:hypothetical protein